MTIGKPHTRVEAPLKVTGAAKYAADVYPAGTLFATTVGAPIAHGRVIGIDVRAALAVRGLVRVLTAADMPRFGKVKAPASVLKLPMQGDWIEWEGQPVAIVVAESLEAAEEAAALVRVAATKAPAMVPGKGKLEVPTDHFAKAHEAKGDVAAGLAKAAVRIEQSYDQPARHHNPMETSSTVAQWVGDKLTLWNSVQATQNGVAVQALAFGIAPEQVRQICPHTGGGFGCKGYVWPHEILAAAAAKLTGRPVRLHLTRAQHYAQVGPQAECRQTVTLGASRDGTLTAIRHHGLNTTSASDMQFEAPAMASRGYYASPAIELDHKVERIHSTLPTAMRAPVEGPGSWALESAMDELAREAGIDPLDLRLRNYSEVEPMDGKPWSSKKLREAFAQAEAAYGWRMRAERPKQDGVWSIGHGLGQASMFCARMPTTATIEVRRDGRVIVSASSNDIGTGVQTVATLVAAEALGVPTDRVEVRWGDSRLPPAGPVYGSSHTMGLGSAVQAAALDARRKLTPYGASPDGPLNFAEILGRADIDGVTGTGRFSLPDDAERNFNGDGTPYAMQTWGVTMVEVGVDRDLGLIRLRRVVARYSAGRIINPLAARGQMVGSIIWEWGKATMEASEIEPRHGRFLAKNLSNVAVPVNADIPSAIDVGFIDEFDGHASLIGAKGIGELGATGVAAAIANAVYDAVGVRARRVPILPGHILDALAAT